MKLWLDAQLPPALAVWFKTELGIEAAALRDLGLRDASDEEIFEKARAAGAVILTKDVDFVTLVGRRGPPPAVIWLTCGNASNAYLMALLGRAWASVHALLDSGEVVIELADDPG